MRDFLHGLWRWANQCSFGESWQHQDSEYQSLHFVFMCLCCRHSKKRLCRHTCKKCTHRFSDFWCRVLSQKYTGLL